ncbi:MAG: amidohydrolase family protein [Candidatus Hydrogenedentales bacterium]|jgi:predicted TIM-barrel fold metal-dependent hydrolase
MSSTGLRIIDFHAHAFPDPVAEKALPKLEGESNVKAALDGKISSLLASMDRAGITHSVVASIATKPGQFDAILKWSSGIASERLIPFPSVHPEDADVPGRVRTIADAGFRGIKMHPYYQEFTVDEERLWPFYRAVRDEGLVLLLHTGFDIAYPHDRIADPMRVVRLIDAFPDLKLVTSHLAAWLDWDEAEKHLWGKPVYMDFSYCLHMIDPARARAALLAHPADYVMFGTDSPWEDQAHAVEAARALALGPERERLMFYGNAARLLGLP